MADLMSKTTLLHIGAGAAEIDGFAKAGTVAGDGLAGFEGPVWGTIRNGRFWEGAGQPAAEQVMHINALALDVTKTQMESANAALAGVCNVFVTCQANLNRVDDYAKSKGCSISEDGTVRWDENNPKKPEVITGHEDTVRRNIEFAAKNILNLATAADHSAKASFDLIGDNVPLTSDTASDLVLDHNKDALDRALEDRQTILEVSAAWLLVDNGSVITANDIAVAGETDIEANLKRKGIDLSAEFALLLSGVGVTPAGKYLNILKGDLPAVLADSIVAGLDKAAGKAAATDAAKALLLRAPGRLLGIAGIATFVGDVAVAVAGALAPEGTPDTYDVVDGNGQVKGKVTDPELAAIAGGFYTHGDNVADRAHQQRVGGNVEDTSRDWIAEAKQVRADLQAYLDAHGGPDPYDPDKQYVQTLIDEIDAAVGDE